MIYLKLEHLLLGAYSVNEYEAFEEFRRKQFEYYDALPIELRDMVKYHEDALNTSKIWYLWMTGKSIEDIRKKYA